MYNDLEGAANSVLHGLSDFSRHCKSNTIPRTVMHWTSELLFPHSHLVFIGSVLCSIETWCFGVFFLFLFFFVPLCFSDWRITEESSLLCVPGLVSPNVQANLWFLTLTVLVRRNERYCVSVSPFTHGLTSLQMLVERWLFFFFFKEIIPVNKFFLFYFGNCIWWGLPPTSFYRNIYTQPTHMKM